jgi:hypothetical protein
MYFIFYRYPGGWMRSATVMGIVGTLLLFCWGPFNPYDPAPKNRGDGDTTQSTQRPAGLVGWWTCDDTSSSVLLDSAGNSDGQIIGCRREAGISGQALNFDGNGDYVLIPSTEDSLFDFGTGDFTISAWVKPRIIEVNPDSMNYGIITKGVARDKGYGLYVERNHFSAFVGRFDSGSNDTVKANDNKWHHCVMVRRKGTVALYLDGKEIQSYANNESVTTGVNLLIGRDASSERENNFPGRIDEIKILNSAWGTTDVNNEYRRFTD